MSEETKIVWAATLVLLPLFVFVVRLLLVLPILEPEPAAANEVSELMPSLRGSHVMVMLGSGGHTGEMLRILNSVDLSGFKRTWVVSSGDTTSLTKAQAMEESRLADSEYRPHYVTLRRARAVGESIASSLVSTLASFADTVGVLWRLPQLPAVLLVNGPGTCVPLAYVLFAMKYLGMCRTRIVYIESLARVTRLSLSGRLILPIANRFVVQWEPLSAQYKRAEYYGVLI
ncbi:UDP-N-acetylglucosamine transferase subunit ALG14 [[Candida] zeylanoides]